MRVWGLGFRVWGQRSSVVCLEFSVWCSGFRVQVLGETPNPSNPLNCSKFKDLRLRFRVW